MSRPTLIDLQKKYAMQPLPNPQSAAVHQTLAGERMTYTVSFPSTGDPDCDLIQGVQAVVKATDVTNACAMRVLRYLVERFGMERDSEKQPPQIDIAQLVKHMVTQELINERLRQAQMTVQPNQPWYGGYGSGIAQCPPATSASQIQSIQQMVKGLDLTP